MKTIFKNTIAILSRRERRKFYFLTAFDIVISVLDIASLALLLFLVSFYTNREMNLPSGLNPGLLHNHPLLSILFFFLFFSVKNLAGYLVYRAEFHFAHGVASRISRYNLLKYLEGHFSDYVNTDSAFLVRKISINPVEFCQHLLTGIQQLIREISLIVLTVAAIFIFNAQLFLILVVIMFPPLLLTNWIIKKNLLAARKFVRDSRTRMFRYVQEAISGFVETNIYGKNLLFTDRYSNSQAELNRHQASLLAIQGVPARLAEIFAVFGLLALIAINLTPGNQYYSNGFITFGAFAASAYKIIPGFARCLNLSSQLKTYAFTLDQISPDAQPPGMAKDISHELHKVSCTNLGFIADQKTIFSNINLDVLPGDFLGISGDSGRGKTTLLNILLGFLDPSKGEVRFNNQRVGQAERKTFWKNISYVKQQPFLIQDSILMNITLDNSDYDEARLNEVVDISGLWPFVRSQDAGLNFVLAENGKNISGGQRQRIAIARALYKNASLIILDEPFSELDKESENNLLELLQQLSERERMVILITHDVNSLGYCNKIVTIDQPTEFKTHA